MRSLYTSRRLAALCVLVTLLMAVGAAAPLADAETVVSLTFDDGLSSIPQAGSILAAHGIKATFYVITGEVGNSGFATWPDIATLADEGHEIGAHTISHSDLPSLTASEQEEQICGSRKQLEEHGYQPRSFAYPYGAFNLESVRLAQACEFGSARLFGTYQGGSGPDGGISVYPEPYSIPNPYELSTQASPERRVELQDLKNDFLWGEGGWVIIALHGVCPSVLNPHESECDGLYGPTSASVLDQYATWINEQPDAVVRTISQVVEDPVLPTTTIACDGESCAGARPGPVEVSLGVTDQNLTVSETRYTTNGSEPTTSSPTYTEPFEVSNTTIVRYRSWDIRGRAEATKSQEIEIDAPPVTKVEAEPSALSSEPNATFTFSADKASTFECSLDNATFGPCSSPYHTNDLAQGSHTFTVRAMDSAGTREAGPSTYAWTVDTVPPVTVIETGPTAVTHSTNASIAFSAGESARFECSLDESDFKACASPYETSDLSDGSHTLAVRATDAAGNTEPRSQLRAWTVDTTPPVAKIESGPRSLTKRADASISFSADEPATFECELDGSEFKACSGRFAVSGLDDGEHTFAVRATDVAGNKGVASLDYSWKVDTTPPTTTIESLPLDETDSDDVSVAFSAREPVAFECSLDYGPYWPCASPYTAKGLGIGFHTVRVLATDPAGNVELVPASYTWTAVSPPIPPPSMRVESKEAAPPGGSAETAPPAATPKTTVGSPRVMVASRVGVGVIRRGLPLRLYCPGSCAARIVVSVVGRGSGRASSSSTRLRVLAISNLSMSKPQTVTFLLRLAPGPARGRSKPRLRDVRLDVVAAVTLAEGGGREARAFASMSGRLRSVLQ